MRLARTRPSRPLAASAPAAEEVRRRTRGSSSAVACFEEMLRPISLKEQS